MGCLPCKFLRRRNDINSVKHVGGEDGQYANAHELTTVTSLASDPLEEIENDITKVDEEIIGGNSKLPGTLDEKDEVISPLLASSASISNVPASSLSLLDHEQTEEDLQHAAILQSVVRAYVMRKNKLKEENMPFSELIVTTPNFSSFILDDDNDSLLIPQVPNYRAHLQQPSNNNNNNNNNNINLLNQSFGIPPPPQPQQSLFSVSSSSIYPPPSQTQTNNNVYQTTQTSVSSSSVYPPTQPFQVPILQEISSPPVLPQIPLRTPTKPLLANTLRHVLSPSDSS